MESEGWKLGRKSFEPVVWILLTMFFIFWPWLDIYAEEKWKGIEKEIEGNVRVYWNAMLNLDYEKAYALTDCSDYAYWLSERGSGVGKKDEDRSWFYVNYRIVGIKMVDASQAIVIVSYFLAGPATEGKYFTKAEVWRKRGKGWVRKCDVGTF